MTLNRLLAVLLLLGGISFAQAWRYDSVSDTVVSGFRSPVPNASVTVCNFPATVVAGSACTNKANICTDNTAVSCTTTGNPLTSDAQGNFGFWIQPNITGYDYTICPSSGSCGGPYHLTASAVLSSNVIWTGTHAFSGGNSQFYNALSSGSPYQIHLSTTSADSGGYLISNSSTGAILSGGAGFNGTNWVAKAAQAGILSSQLGVIDFFEDTGLTIGNTYTPTSRFRITSSGIPQFIQGYTDWLNPGNCTTLSAVGHGVLCFDNGAQQFKMSLNGGAFNTVNAGTGYSTVLFNNSALTARSQLNLISSGGVLSCIDNSGASRTDCTFSAPTGDLSLGDADHTIGYISNTAATRTLTISGGTSSHAGNNVQLLGGTPLGGAGNANGGDANVLSGRGSGTGSGGNIDVQAADGGNSNAAGGTVSILGGAGSGTANGGFITIHGGQGGVLGATGDGGPVALVGGNSLATNGNGGNITLLPGNKSGAGTNGVVEIDSGILGDGSGFKHKRISTGAIGATTRTEVVLTWSTTFADANYTAWCNVEDSTTAAGTQGLTGERIRTKSATQVGYVINNPTGGGITGTLDCSAAHD